MFFFNLSYLVKFTHYSFSYCFNQLLSHNICDKKYISPEEDEEWKIHRTEPADVQTWTSLYLDGVDKIGL